MPERDEAVARARAHAPEELGPRPRYSVIVPCFNEEASLPSLAARLERLAEALSGRGGTEVVLVDDGSRDTTAERARELFAGWEFFSLVRHARNMGIGVAMTTGIGMATGEVICTLDADGTYDPLILVELIARIEGGADLATASPYHPEGAVEGVGRFRLLLSRGLSGVYSAMFPSRLYTYTSCLRAYREQVVRRSLPRSPGFQSVAEMLCLALLQGYRVAEVPARLSSRAHGASKMRVGREIFHHLRHLAQIWMRSGPYGRTQAR